MVSLIPPQFKALAIAAAFAVTFGAGWAVNGWRLNAKHDAERLAAEKDAKAAYDAKAKQYNEAAQALEVARNDREIVYRTITKQVEKVVDRPVYRNVCLDSDGLRIVNDALAGRAADPGKPDAAVPAADTP